MGYGGGEEVIAHPGVKIEGVWRRGCSPGVEIEVIQEEERSPSLLVSKSKVYRGKSGRRSVIVGNVLKLRNPGGGGVIPPPDVEIEGVIAHPGIEIEGNGGGGEVIARPGVEIEEKLHGHR